MDIKGKRVLITGGTGSFGNQVANYLAGKNPKGIVIFSRDEKKQYDMRKDFPDYEYVIGDVRDANRLHTAMKGVDYVFHAAALKQVPSCEEYPEEAVKTNIIGSQNVCETAIRNGVQMVVALSTDKAVKPVNAMGISKSMMEKIICSQNRQPLDTRFCCVRYGNVMGSRGSVIPLFDKLIRDDQKLTITDPHMTRFLMTLDQSVELVLHAMTQGKGGEIYVKKAPAATVQDLAAAMLARAGKPVDQIAIVGIRPGEKIDEVLVNEYEITRAVESKDYFEIIPEYKENNGNANYEPGYEYTSANTTRLKTVDEIGVLLDAMGQRESYH
ncbi:MAG: polysaccharide biosynthesis protein [Flavobacteriales bacterium]|nr:polysaccharide biosynthesis protein [Flavobacteriales bacterium]MCB9447563.1 polysaccharide biosynthesis protein [Flavobacteriales bacterium]